MIRCALPELILEPCVSPHQLAYLLIQRISLRHEAAFLRQGLQRPAMRRLAPRRQVRRVQALSPQELTYLAGLGAPVRLFDDTAACTTDFEPPSVAAYLLPLGPQELHRFAWHSPVPGSLPFSFHSLWQSQHVRFHRASNYSNSLRAPCLTYVGREGYLPAQVIYPRECALRNGRHPDSLALPRVAFLTSAAAPAVPGPSRIGVRRMVAVK